MHIYSICVCTYTGHRKFDCVVTCFFIDTGDDLIDYFQTIDKVVCMCMYVCMYACMYVYM